MSRQCKCGETFETLTQFRIHQRDECRFSEEHDIKGQSEDEISQQIIDELLVCESCGERSDEVREIEREITDAGLSIVARFSCDCGWQNENTAILK